jgi:hypothetical protein
MCSIQKSDPGTPEFPSVDRTHRSGQKSGASLARLPVETADRTGARDRGAPHIDPALADDHIGGQPSGTKQMIDG